jgi:hypothetical protein
MSARLASGVGASLITRFNLHAVCAVGFLRIDASTAST